MAWHARISASSMKRVLKCPGSVALIERIPKHLRRGSGEAARLGTAAHGLGEYCLVHKIQDSKELLGGVVWLDANDDATVVDPRIGADGDMSAAVHTYPIDDDMTEAVNTYLRVVAEEAAKLSDPELLVEKRFDLNWLRPDLGGTSDCNIYEFMGTLVVIDYKHGMGVAVEVDDNPQMLTYGLGSAKEFDWLFDRLILIIVQPRCPHAEGGVRRWETTKERLLEFQQEVAEGYDRVMQAGKLLEEGLPRQLEHEGDEYTRSDWDRDFLKAGDHCTFCDVGALCPAKRLKIQEMARFDFADVCEDEEALVGALPDPEAPDFGRMIGEVLEWVPALDNFIKSAKRLGYAHAVAGHEVLGQKLVEGRANRKLIVPEAKVVERLTAAGIAKDRLYELPKLKSPAQLEKIGAAVKKMVNGVPNPKAGEEGQPNWSVEPLAAKGQAGLSLVPLSNPKPAVTIDAGADFSGVEEDDGG